MGRPVIGKLLTVGKAGEQVCGRLQYGILDCEMTKFFLYFRGSEVRRMGDGDGSGRVVRDAVAG